MRGGKLQSKVEAVKPLHLHSENNGWKETFIIGKYLNLKEKLSFKIDES